MAGELLCVSRRSLPVSSHTCLASSCINAASFALRLSALILDPQNRERSAPVTAESRQLGIAEHLAVVHQLSKLATAVRWQNQSAQ